MKHDDILALTAMPHSNPSYPPGPYQLVNREYLIITYQSDPAAIRSIVLDPSHINAPVADLPVRSVIEGRHFKADLTLPYDRILHSNLAPEGAFK